MSRPTMWTRLLPLFLLVMACRPPSVSDGGPGAHASQADLAAAKALFERNLQAIRDRDKDAYLSCYRADERLVRAGPGGPQLGFADLAAGTSSVASTWPRKLEASELKVFPVAPGVVYGSYRYRVTIDGETTDGWSERVFLKTDAGWRIAVTTAFQDP